MNMGGKYPGETSKVTLATAPNIAPVKNPWDTELPNCNVSLVQVKDSDNV
jgi:hypothetical protein